MMSRSLGTGRRRLRWRSEELCRQEGLGQGVVSVSFLLERPRNNRSVTDPVDIARYRRCFEGGGAKGR